MQGLEPRADETFDLFISYAHADDAEGHVSRFVELLRQVRDTQQYRSWQIFFDQKAIVAGDDWQQRLARVKAAGALIVLMSSNYFHSREPHFRPGCAPALVSGGRYRGPFRGAILLFWTRLACEIRIRGRCRAVATLSSHTKIEPWFPHSRFFSASAGLP